MRALIVTKPTNLEQHGEVVKSQIKRGHLSSEHLHHLEKAHEEHYASLEKVKEVFKKLKIQFELISRGDTWTKEKNYAFVTSVGGDGTLLSACHRILNEVPVIGIKSSNSSVGYLCAGGFENIEDIFTQHMNNKLEFIQCSRLRAAIFYAEENQERMTVPVLNDFLFANHNPSATSRYRIFAGDKMEVHKSSGVWVSTATGSSAGIYAAGGEMMDRIDRRFQYRVRELYRGDANSLALTSGFFDPDESKFVIENRNEAAVLALDGQRGVIPLKFGDSITFQRGPKLFIAKGIGQAPTAP